MEISVMGGLYSVPFHIASAAAASRARYYGTTTKNATWLLNVKSLFAKRSSSNVSNWIPPGQLLFVEWTWTISPNGPADCAKSTVAAGVTFAGSMPRPDLGLMQ